MTKIMEIIYILWLRQIKKYFRSKSRVIGSLGQPVLFMLAFGFGFGPVFAKAGQGNYLEFLVPGIITMSIVFMAIFSGLEIIWDRQFGFLKEMLVAPVSRLRIMVGRSLGGATVASIQGVIVLLLSLFIGFRPANIPFLLFGLFFMFLISLIFTLLGTGIACLLKDFSAFQLIVNFLIMPLVFLSGAFFPLAGLPKALYNVVIINPLSYGVDSLRETLSSAGHFALWHDFSVLLIVAAVFTVLSSYLFSKIEA
jgi:ABC-2 type transport system permease protein